MNSSLPMKIKEITLYTNQLQHQKVFYSSTLGFKILEETPSMFSIQIKNTNLRFFKSKKDHKYHYCFLIPSNKLDEAIHWLKKRLPIIKIEGQRIKQKFESWNAESVYFYDGAGNLAEFIVRYDLKNEQATPFNLSQFLSVNEIGMPTNNITALNDELEQKLHTHFWKGDLERFGTNGSQNGLFLLVNNTVKKNWFPTTITTEAAPFEALIVVDKKKHKIIFEDGKIKGNT